MVLTVCGLSLRSLIEVIAEGMTLAEKNGLQRHSVVQFVETLFPGHIFKGAPGLCRFPQSSQMQTLTV